MNFREYILARIKGSMRGRRILQGLGGVRLTYILMKF